MTALNNWELLLLGIAIGVPLGVVIIYVANRPVASSATLAVPRTYSNLEEWEIVRDKDGRTKGVRVKRDA